MFTPDFERDADEALAPVRIGGECFAIALVFAVVLGVLIAPAFYS